MQAGSQAPRFKLVLVGDAAVGKSTFLMRHLCGEFERKHIPTMTSQPRDLQFYTTIGALRFEVWDCPPSPEAVRESLVGASGVIIAFDASQKETAKGARSWYKLVRDSAGESLLVAVCGFKADLRVRSRTPVKVPGVPYWPVSARSNYNFEKPFLFFARRLTGDRSLAFVEAPALCPPEISLGFSVGGSKDCVNFRKKIELGVVPSASDLTCEGLFAEYSFKTDASDGDPATSSAPSANTAAGDKAEAELFAPTYTDFQSRHPITMEDELFLSVGLTSNLKASQFPRKPLNLVITLDISGSMGCTFDIDCAGKPKIEIAKEAILTLLDQLKPDDKLGIVLFDHRSQVFEQVSPILQKDIGQLKQRLMTGVSACGGTDMKQGMQQSIELVMPHIRPIDTHENRIVFLTDAQPTHSDLSGQGLRHMIQTSAGIGLFTTFIGVGVDFNSELIEEIVKVRGANYFAVHSVPEFKARMNEGFDNMVNPLLFDLHFQLDSMAFDVVEVFGSGDSTPRKDLRTVMHVSSLFPSTSTTAEGTKGGLILLKLRRKLSFGGGKELKRKQPSDDTINEGADEMIDDHPSGNSTGDMMLFTISYSERSGATKTSSRWATLNSTAGRAAVKSTRKGVLLARYVQLVREWIADKRNQTPTPPTTYTAPSAPFAFQASSTPSFLFGPPAPVTSAFAPSPASFSFGSAPANAAPADTLPPATAATASGDKALDWNARFAAFLDHFEREMEQVGDDSLSKEVEVLTTLASKASELRPSHGSAGDMSIQLALWQHEETAVGVCQGHKLRWRAPNKTTRWPVVGFKPRE